MELTLEELQSKILELETKIADLETEKTQANETIEQLNQEKEEITNRNKKLEEHNQQLFLRATASFNNSLPNTGENGNDNETKVLKEFSENLKEDEINILLDLIEGEN